MPYYHSRVLDTDMDHAIERVKAALQEEGFGIITDINLKETFQKKLGVEFRPYRILGACNPNYALEALKVEDKIGTMLPCNIIVQDTGQGVEVAAVSPLASMASVENADLKDLASSVEEKLGKVIENL